jgi:hypothetical protein
MPQFSILPCAPLMLARAWRTTRFSQTSMVPTDELGLNGNKDFDAATGWVASENPAVKRLLRV